MAKHTRTTTVTLSKEEAAEIIAKGVGVNPADCKVGFTIGEVDRDPLDRYPGRSDVIKVTVTYEDPQ